MDCIYHTFPHLIIMLSIIHAEVVRQIVICFSSLYFFLLVGAGITTLGLFFEILKKNQSQASALKSLCFLKTVLTFPDTALLAVSDQPSSSSVISFASLSSISNRP